MRRRSAPAVAATTVSRRGALLAAAGATLFAATHRLLAQTDTRRVAYLSISSPSAGTVFQRVTLPALRDLGWREGGNLILDVRWAHGDAARWAPLTSELLALRPDVFVATTDNMIDAAIAATKTVPIVFIIGNGPVARGLVRSLASPGGNVTGFATLDIELYPKRLALLKEAVPGLTKVGVIVSSGDRFGLDAMADAQRRLGLEFVTALMDRAEEIDPAFDKFAKAGVQGVIDYAASGTTFIERERIAALAIRHRMAMFGFPPMADSGVLLAYGFDNQALFKRAARLVDRILRGTKPADIPVEQINEYELTVNLRTARALDIELPRSLMLRATRVIE